MTYPLRVTRGGPTSLRNPCPEGTDIGTGTYNGTILLICDAAFVRSSSAVELDLALGLGLGIPGCLIFLLMLLRWYKRRVFVESQTPQVQPHQEETLNPTSLLSEGAYFYFSSDTLSERLKRELMILRIQKGRNLSDFVKQAEAKNAFAVASWIDHLNPGEFPMDIRRAASTSSSETL